MATQSEVLEAVQKKKILLDVRDKDEWIGESSSPYGKDFAPRKGRLEVISLEQKFWNRLGSYMDWMVQLNGKERRSCIL